MRESVIEKKVVEYASELGWWCLKLHIINHIGFPDRLCLAENARVKFVEFKAPGQKPRKSQKFVISKLRKLGFDVFVVDSIDVGKAVFNFKKLKDEKRTTT